MAEVLDGLARAKVNILVSGGTGSGKTTLLNILSGFIPADERIVTIEDAAELQLRQEHVLRLETRPPNIEGRGEITQRTLVRNALRMRPDRIILGEVRGDEALDMLNAMNTGHEGSLATIHANTPRDALTRLENMISMGGLSLPTKTMRQQIASAISVVVQATRLTDGRRKIISIYGADRHGGRHDQHAGNLHVPALRRRFEGQRAGAFLRDRGAAEILRAPARVRRGPAGAHLRPGAAIRNRLNRAGGK